MRKIFKWLTNPKFILIVIIVVGFSLRLYKLDSPIADWHSWRQADTAAVARNFFKDGYNPFVPKYDDMSGVAQNPIPNPGRYRFVEFPISNSLTYFLYQVNGAVDERLARLVSIFFSVGSTILLYLIVKRHWGIVTALISSLLFAILPFNIYFSRVILPEPALVFFCLGMFFFVERWILEEKQKLFWPAVLFTAAAFLTKPMAIFYLLPLAYVYYQKENKWFPVPSRYIKFALLSLLPFGLWRIWILQHPEGIPASNWLLNGDGIRLKPSFFKWILVDRFGREILSVTGTFLFFLGLLIKPLSGEGKLLHWLGLSGLAYLVVFATGNVRHDYYQTLIVPILVMFVARGFVLLVKGVNGFIPRIFTIPMAFLFLILMLMFTWTEVKGLYQVNNNSIVTAGKRADKVLPKDAIVIAPYNGDTSFLYQTNRAGWPFVAYPVDELKEKFGANYYISVNYDAKTKWVIRKYKVLEATPEYVIADLREVNPGFDFKNDLEPPQ